MPHKDKTKKYDQVAHCLNPYTNTLPARIYSSSSRCLRKVTLEIMSRERRLWAHSRNRFVHCQNDIFGAS